MLEINELIEKQAKVLPIFLLLDCSGSMSGEKIDTLNQCVRDMVKDFQNERMTEVNLKVCVISFGGNGATLNNDLTGIKDFQYNDLTADGMTPLGSALTLASSIINDKERVSGKGYRPIVVLVSDGYPNDSWEAPLDEFVNGKRTSKCEKWSLGIGSDYDAAMLKQFLNDDTRQVFDASVAQEITKFFKLVTLSTIAKTRSQNPNASINLEDLKAQFEDECPTYDFGLNVK